jgi:hypothetical protein
VVEIHARGYGGGNSRGGDNRGGGNRGGLIFFLAIKKVSMKIDTFFCFSDAQRKQKFVF